MSGLGLGEQAGISVGTSVLSIGLFQCFKLWKKRNLYGCLIPKGKTYAQNNLVNERKLIFIDLDGTISEGVPLHKLDKSKLRLEMFVKGVETLKLIVENHPNKKIVFCSSDYELLCHLGLKKKTWAFIPSKDMIEKETDDKQIVERMAYQFQTELDKKKQVFYNNYDELTRRLYRVYM